MAGNVQAVTRALRILEAVADAGGVCGVRDLARRLDLKPPTIHGLMQTLAAQGYLERTGAGYRLGFKCMQLAGAFFKDQPLRDVARPYMEELVERVGETVSLAVLGNSEVIWIAHALGTRNVVAAHEQSAHPYETACGRVLLAHTPSEAVRDFIAHHPLGENAADDLRTLHDLERELRAIRRQGYAIFRGKGLDGSSAVAAPIHDHTGSIVGAIGVVMPSARFQGEHLATAIEAVRATARRISEQLGGATNVPEGLSGLPADDEASDRRNGRHPREAVAVAASEE